MDMPDIPKKTILFLKGVFPEECIKVEDKILNQMDQSSTINGCTIDSKKKIIYDSIPKQFTSVKNWIDLTKNIRIKCWYCELLFVGVPVFIPSYINKTYNGNTYDVHGIFCNFGCACQYLLTNAKFIEDKTQWDKMEMLKIIFNLFHNHGINDFIPAPNKYNLTCYGGNMTTVAFKKELKRINNLNMNNCSYKKQILK